MRRRPAAILALLLVVWSSTSAAAKDVLGKRSARGATVRTLGRTTLEGYRRAVDRGGLPGAKPPFFRYTTTANCANSAPLTTVHDASCGSMNTPCAGNTPAQGDGPAVKVFRSRVDAQGRPVGATNAPVTTPLWDYVGITCFPDLVPGQRRSLTMAQIRAAFHDTAFAEPALHIQPEGNLTLVNLPTYFETRWPASGYQPDEVDTVDPARVSGFAVDVRPRLRSITYLFGDGSSAGPTPSLGGPYPSGDVTHTYARAGSYRPHATVTYTGQYRVGGGAWIDIPDAVAIRGPSSRLSVTTAHARLYSAPD